MDVSATAASLNDVRLWRDMYRLEMGCQIVHDSIHNRSGWTQEYLLFVAGLPVGYGSVAVGGPWEGQPTAYEFYVVPYQRLRMFDVFRALLAASGAISMAVQSNDALATAMLHAFVPQVTSEAILFHDKLLTSHAPPGATFRQPTAAEVPGVLEMFRRWHGVVDLEGVAAASGGIRFHYRPFGDIYMDVAEPFRRRGLGAFIVQELKRVCYEGGHVPAARCSPQNLASQRTLQKAGFVPCGHILKGAVPAPDVGRPV